MSQSINITSLSAAAQKYQPQLQMLPFLILEPVAKELGINLLEVNYKDTITEYQRKGNLSRPYAATDDADTLAVSEIGKAVERHLIVETSVLPLVENVRNYREKKIVSLGDNKVDNQSKKHPQEKLILDSVVKTASEDILTCVFPGVRDAENKTPIAMFNGVDECIDIDIAAGEISTAKGNYIELAANPFAAPVDEEDYTAYKNLVIFLRSCNTNLRKNGALYLPDQVLFNAQQALANKLRFKDVFSVDAFLAYLRGDANAKNLEIISHEIMGTGDRIMMMKRANMDLGLSTLSDHQFVQVRNPFKDPNLVQYWMQWDAGFRINSVHAKNCAISNGTPVADLTISGDYQS
jgi:hypothetical protein